jgi:transcriptional regulator with XRE-family HTH domain
MLCRMKADDDRLGELFRALRRQARRTQEEISIATSVPVRDIAKLESGRVGDIVFGRVSQLFAEVGARARVAVWWHGAAADRLLDERHAAIVDHAAGFMARWAWTTAIEFTFSEYGERGSIDIFGHRRSAGAVAVCEVKSTFGALEEMNRTLDVKVRLAPKLCRDRFGWTPDHVARLLIVPEASTIRRIVTAHRTTMDAIYPARGRQIRAWLGRPAGNIAGIWFLSDPRNTLVVPDPTP